MDSKDVHIYEEIITLLPQIGVQPDVAKVIVCLLQKSAVTVKSISKHAEISVPRVREILSDFQKLSWVNVTQGDSARGGPAVNVYTLAVPFTTIVESVEKEVLRQQAEYQAAVDYLRSHSRST